MFNTEDWPVVHMIFAVTFFGGNVAVMIWWSDAPAKYRYAFAGVVVVGMILLATDVISVWLAEFVSLLAIAAHYILDSMDVKYKALPRGQNPWSRQPKSSSAEAS
jgi:hypothetical protein